MSAIYLLLLLLLPLVSAQTYHWGPCPTPKVQPNFNLQQVTHTYTHTQPMYYMHYAMKHTGLITPLCRQYLGRWYEIEKLPASFERGKCIEANYGIRSDGTIRVLNSQF